MRGQDLYRAIDAVDDKYIDQVYKDQTKRRKPLS
jgi:ribosome-associated translation inhibitor RaiA